MSYKKRSRVPRHGRKRGSEGTTSRAEYTCSSCDVPLVRQHPQQCLCGLCLARRAFGGAA